MISASRGGSRGRTRHALKVVVLFFSTTPHALKNNYYAQSNGYDNRLVVIYRSFWIVLTKYSQTSKNAVFIHVGAAVKPVPIRHPAPAAAGAKSKTPVLHHRRRRSKTKLNARQGFHRTDTMRLPGGLDLGAAVAADANADGNETATPIRRLSIEYKHKHKDKKITRTHKHHKKKDKEKKQHNKHKHKDKDEEQE